MLNTRIEHAIDELLDENLETISEDSMEILHYLFDDENGWYLFDKWVQERPEQNIIIKNVDFDQMYEVVSNKITMMNLSEQQRDRRQKIHLVSKSVIGWFQRVAAILIVPLILGAAMLMFSLQERSRLLQEELCNVINLNPAEAMSAGIEYLSPPGARLNITLPDSTEVCLNGNSRLIVSKMFGIKDRVVRIEGEALFSVAADTTKQFVVKADNIDVTALGTSFYIRAYPADNRVETVLLTGKVSIDTPRNAQDGESILLYPNQKYVYYKDVKNDELAKGIRVKKYEAWTVGELIFEDESMAQIISRLESFYNVKIDVLNKEIYTYRFTASIKDCSLEQIMEYLKLSSPIDYKIEKNHIILNTTK